MTPDVPAIVQRLEQRVQRLEEIDLELGAVRRLLKANHEIGESTIKVVHARVDELRDEMRDGFRRIEAMLQKAVLDG